MFVVPSTVFTLYPKQDVGATKVWQYVIQPQADRGVKRKHSGCEEDAKE